MVRTMCNPSLWPCPESRRYSEPASFVAVPKCTMILNRLAVVAIAVAGLPACSPVERGSADSFTRTGELIALSGGDAGAANACITCHGIDGRGNGAGTPRLAGLDRGYMAAQLEAYASGRRHHPEMAYIADKLTPAQHDSVSAYFARMPYVYAAAGTRISGHASTLYHHGDPQRGLASCASCHGERGEGVGAANPPLAGQPAPYLAEQLDQWRAGRRRNDPQNMMLRISQALSGQEAAALSAYASRLGGTVPRREFGEASLAGHRGDPRSGASAPPPREAGHSPAGR